MHIFLIITIAVSLSMDAFSLSLAYGTLNLRKKDIISLAVIVGIYHFFMPLLGNLAGSMFLKVFPVSPELIVFVVLGFIGVQMIIEGIRGNEEIKGVLRIGVIESLLFANLKNIIPRFRSTFKNVNVQIKMGQTTELVEMLKQNKLDLIYISADNICCFICSRII